MFHPTTISNLFIWRVRRQPRKKTVTRSGERVCSAALVLQAPEAVRQVFPKEHHARLPDIAVGRGPSKLCVVSVVFLDGRITCLRGERVAFHVCHSCHPATHPEVSDEGRWLGHWGAAQDPKVPKRVRTSYEAFCRTPTRSPNPDD